MNRTLIATSISDLIPVCPVVRYKYAFSAKPYDSGTQSDQFMAAVDAIFHS